VWAFDPQHILGPEQGMWFNPLRAVATITDARRLGEHFAAARLNVQRCCGRSQPMAHEAR